MTSRSMAAGLPGSSFTCTMLLPAPFACMTADAVALLFESVHHQQLRCRQHQTAEGLQQQHVQWPQLPF